MRAINSRYEAQQAALGNDPGKSSDSQDFEDLMRKDLPPDVLSSWGIDVQ